MLSRFIAVLAVGLSVFCATARAQQQPALPVPSGTYVLEKTHASLLWRVPHMGLSNYTARFTRFDVTLQLDAADLSRSRVRATVDMSSVETDFVPAGGRDWNAELRAAPFFDAAKFPQAVFESTRVTGNGAKGLRVDGNLTFLGVTRPVTLDATINGTLASHPFAKVPALGISATGRVPRLAFGLNPPPIQQGVGESVELVIEAEFLQQK